MCVTTAWVPALLREAGAELNSSQNTGAHMKIVSAGESRGERGGEGGGGGAATRRGHQQASLLLGASQVAVGLCCLYTAGTAGGENSKPKVRNKMFDI